MDFTFVRMVHFTKLLHAGGRLREFNFRKLKPAEAGERYSIDVADDRGDRIIFKMLQQDPGWSVETPEPLPDWVTSIIPALKDIVSEEPVSSS